MYNSRNIPRRPINYTSNNSNGESLSSKKFDNRRPLRIYVGDMVQVIDSKSSLFKKFGLVEKICPHNSSYQVLVKIGKASNELFFSQLKFCTRINSNSAQDSQEVFIPGLRNSKGKIYKDGAVEDFIDQIDEDEDNKGNREGANEKHGLL